MRSSLAVITQKQPWRSDFSFHRDEATRWLPYIIGAMVFLTLLLMLCVLSVNSQVDARTDAILKQAMVHIPATAENRQTLLKDALEVLKKDPAVKHASPVSDAKVADLLSPWLGETTTLVSNLPIPMMIDVTLSTTERSSLRALEKKLAEVNSQITFEDHASWMEDFNAYQGTIQNVGLFIVALLLAVLAGVVVFAAVTVLRLHHEEVGLLHSLGASRRYVANQFQMQMAHIAARGVLAGSVAAAIIFTLLGFLMPEDTNAILPHPQWSLNHFITWMVLLFATWVLSVIAARTAVSKRLKLFY